MDKTQKTIISALAVVFALMLGALVVLPAVVDNGTTVGTFKAPDFDPAAVPGVPQTAPERQFAWLQMGDDIRVGLCGSPVLTDGGAELYFASESTNTAWLLVKVMDENGNELGRSGLIRPGEYVRAVALDPAPGASCAISVKILSYEPETYYSLGSATAQLLLTAE